MEDIPLANVIRALPPRQGRLIEHDVADEVEGIEVLSAYSGFPTRAAPAKAISPWVDAAFSLTMAAATGTPSDEKSSTTGVTN